MINKTIFEWTEQDLQELINKKISESLKLEYKQTIEIDKPKARKELCKDFSAMANSFGGKIIYGLAESEQKDAGSIPVALTPIKNHLLKETMQQIITDGILPRMDFQIANFESKQKPGYEYIVVDIPQSIRGPHFVCLKDNRFYKRRDYEAKSMDQREIEDAYRNFFFQEMKMNNLFDEIKKVNPNKRLGLPKCAFCSIYFVLQHPVKDLFSRKYNHISITDRVISLSNIGYDCGYQNSFKNSYDGFTNIRKIEDLVCRQDVFHRDGCIMYSFSIFNSSSKIDNSLYISLDWLALVLLEILKLIPKVYEECDYLGNLKVILNLECIDNYKLHAQDIFSNSSVIQGGNFESFISTTIDKMLIDPKKELIPILTHLMQSFGIDFKSIDKFINRTFLDKTFGD